MTEANGVRLCGGFSPLKGEWSRPTSSSIKMGFRHMLMAALIILFSFCAFASKVLWIQWTTTAIFMGFFLLFDLMFLDASAFVFDPDPDNWRRRVSRD